MYTMPGDPTQATTKVLPEAVQKNLEEKWGLDKPVTETICHLPLKICSMEIWENHIKHQVCRQIR